MHQTNLRMPHVLLLFLAGLVGMGCSVAEHGVRASATTIERPGLPNLHKVSPVLFRGAQPTAVGMRELKKLGVRTVVNLRSFHSDQNEIGDTVLAYEHISMKSWHPEVEDIVRFLRIVTDPNRTPSCSLAWR